MATCGEVLIEILESYGVDLVFGIPGVHTIELYRGLARSSIRHVTPRHEQGAGFMADGYARVTGQPGVCFIITGPGMTNVATAMGQAYGDSVPMLVISSVNSSEHLGLGEGRLHELTSQRGLISHVSAFSHTLMRPEELPQVIARAFAVFSGARPRPVHIEIPLDVMAMEADGLDRTRWNIPSAPGPNRDAVQKAANVLNEARRPLVIIGGGAADGSADVRQLIEFIDAPTINTVNAKGILGAEHELYAGENLGYPALRSAVRDADVVLAIGTEIGETEHFPNREPIEFPGTLIRIDIDPEQLVRNAIPDIAVAADAGRTAAELLKALRVDGNNRLDRAENGRERAQRIRDAVRSEWWDDCEAYVPILGAIRDTLPDVVVVGDSTQPSYAANQFFQCDRPRSFFSAATGFGTLGYALPAAIGAKIAAPERPVVAVIGDGGLQFTLPELASAKEAGAAVIVVLWNNHGYGEIKKGMIEAGVEPEGVDLFTPDFEKISEGFGFSFVRAGSLGDFREILGKAHKSGEPTVVEIMHDEVFAGGSRATPAWSD